MTNRDKMHELALIKTRIVALTGIGYNHPLCLEINRLRDELSLAVDRAELDVVGEYNRRRDAITQEYIEIRRVGSNDVTLVPRYSQQELDDHAYAQEMQDASEFEFMMEKIRAHRAKFKQNTGV